MEHGDIMSKTPYELIGQKALYQMIDHFYQLVEKDSRINHLFPGDFKETSRKQKQFLTQFLGGPDLYTQEHGHPMLKRRHMELKTYGIYNYRIRERCMVRKYAPSNNKRTTTSRRR